MKKLTKIITPLTLFFLLYSCSLTSKKKERSIASDGNTELGNIIINDGQLLANLKESWRFEEFKITSIEEKSGILDQLLGNATWLSLDEEIFRSLALKGEISCHDENAPYYFMFVIMVSIGPEGKATYTIPGTLGTSGLRGVLVFFSKKKIWQDNDLHLRENLYRDSSSVKPRLILNSLFFADGRKTVIESLTIGNHHHFKKLYNSYYNSERSATPPKEALKNLYDQLVDKKRSIKFPNQPYKDCEFPKALKSIFE